MSIDWNAFTPWSSLAGGLLIGTAAAALALFNGRIAGIIGGLVAFFVAYRRTFSFLGGNMHLPKTGTIDR